MLPELHHERRTVLVVDDDVDTRAALRLVLEDEGFRVESAGDGLTALQKIRDQAPDLVVLDLHMPRMGGEDFLDQWRRGVEAAGVPVIVITAISRGVGPENLGVDALLTKPFDLDALVRLVRRLVESSPGASVTVRGDSRIAELRDVADDLADAVTAIVMSAEEVANARDIPDDLRPAVLAGAGAAQRASSLVRRLQRVVGTLE